MEQKLPFFWQIFTNSSIFLVIYQWNLKDQQDSQWTKKAFILDGCFWNPEAVHFSQHEQMPNPMLTQKHPSTDYTFLLNLPICILMHFSYDIVNFISCFQAKSLELRLPEMCCLMKARQFMIFPQNLERLPCLNRARKQWLSHNCIFPCKLK